MPLPQALAAVLSDKSRFGQLLICRTSAGGFVVCHRMIKTRTGLKLFRDPEDAVEIARYDDAGRLSAAENGAGICDTGGGSRSPILANCVARSIIFILDDWQCSRRGQKTNSRQRRCAKRWIDNRECIKWRRRLRTSRLMMWSAISADQTADACGLFCGSETRRGQFRLQNSHRRSLIRRTIRPGAPKRYPAAMSGNLHFFAQQMPQGR